MIKINESSIRLKCPAKFLAGNDFSSFLEKGDEKQERLVLQLNLDAVFAKLTCSNVDLKNSKADRAHG
jgi:hypothetical protein